MPRRKLFPGDHDAASQETGPCRKEDRGSGEDYRENGRPGHRENRRTAMILPVAKGLPERDQLFHVRMLRAVQRVAAGVPQLRSELPEQARQCRDFKLCNPCEPFGLRRMVRT